MDAHGATWTRKPANGHAHQRMDTHETDLRYKGFKDEMATLSQKLSSE